MSLIFTVRSLSFQLHELMDRVREREVLVQYRKRRGEAAGNGSRSRPRQDEIYGVLPLDRPGKHGLRLFRKDHPFGEADCGPKRSLVPGCVEQRPREPEMDRSF